MAGNEQSSRAELFILVNAIRETRRRRFNMQMALHHLVTRRRQALNVSLLLLLLISSQRDNIATVPRSCRRLGRNTGWWDTVWNTYSDARFKKTFRISRSTLKFILNRIGPFLARKTVSEEPISPELRSTCHLFVQVGQGRLFVYHR